ncbi:hypothetical protein GCM10011445_27470 [Pseudocitrobacter faecalis]|nr:hypothetical protein GCM10011445_27470 [Pseudocitrobacter faecalis]
MRTRQITIGITVLKGSAGNAAPGITGRAFLLFARLFPHQALAVSNIPNVVIPEAFWFAGFVGGKYSQPDGDEQTKELSKND